MIRSTMAVAAALLPLMGCGEGPGFIGVEPPNPLGEPIPPENVSKTDVIVQVTTPQVDALYVIDNSCSMFQEQADLSQNFPFFINYFLGSGLDYHVGVTSTDMDGTFGPNGTKGVLRQVQGFRFLDPDTPNQAQVFTAMASMGTSGSASERGTSATYAALELKRDEVNAGFYRDDASLHTVLVSDEPNQIRGGEIDLREFIDWYDGLKREADDRTFSSIVNQTGGEYKTVTNQIGGIEWDISSGAWRQVLDRLGVQASGLKREYFLSERPVDPTIEVQVAQPVEGEDNQFNTIDFERATYDKKGELTNKDPRLAWEYNTTRNSITFLNFVPEALSRVLIRYNLLAATQDDDLVEETQGGTTTGGTAP